MASWSKRASTSESARSACAALPLSRGARTHDIGIRVLRLAVLRQHTRSNPLERPHESYDL